MAKDKKRKAAAGRKLDPSLPLFQLRISLRYTEPEIWRQIQTHDCTLDELHELIQSCMGWEDDHLHVFEVGRKQYTRLERGMDRREFTDSSTVRLSALVGQGHTVFVYEYDFGDSWRHDIVIEATLPVEEGVSYPRCLDGRRACPPEDCGGSWGYERIVDILADPEDEEYEETRDRVGDDFDPDAFSVDAVNDDFFRMRRWLGRRPIRPDQTAAFAVGDRVRVKPGVAHRWYPDLPLGGWVGTVARIAWLIPISYEVHWTPETLAAAHPVYAKRCRRDFRRRDAHLLDEGELEPDAPDEPAVMDQPTNLASRPLSLDDPGDRVRMVFGLTSDDALPPVDAESLSRYAAYLKSRLVFPFNAWGWEFTRGLDLGQRFDLTALGLAASLPDDWRGGVPCEIRRKDSDQTELFPLDYVRLDYNDGEETESGIASRGMSDEEKAVRECLDDHHFWLLESRGNEYFDQLDDESYWTESDEDEDEDFDGPWDGGEEEDEDDWNADGDFDGVPPGWLSSGEGDETFPKIQPIHREDPPVGRNDLCPCGSGKKFKKCCLMKNGK